MFRRRRGAENRHTGGVIVLAEVVFERFYYALQILCNHSGRYVLNYSLHQLYHNIEVGHASAAERWGAVWLGAEAMRGAQPSRVSKENSWILELI